MHIYACVVCRGMYGCIGNRDAVHDISVIINSYAFVVCKLIYHVSPDHIKRVISITWVL